MQLGPMSDIFRACAAIVPPEDLTEGDFYINNDPYGGGQHLQDVFIFSPIFVSKELVGFAGTVSHHLDLGGGNPGLSPDAVDVHAEGIIFPPSMYNFARDWNGGPLERLVAANVRVPDQTIGDFYAQFAANAIGAERVKQLCGKYGIETVTRTMTELIDYSERRFRAALSEVPDGEYFGEDAIDDDGLSDENETLVYGTDPYDSDTDDDGLSDYDEVMVYGTDPLLIDSDLDGLSDSAEVTTTGTCLLYTSPSPRDATLSRMPSSA